MSITLESRLMQGFALAFGSDCTPQLISRAPGRVNLMGEHTDYNEGFALPIAIGQETQVAFAPRINCEILEVASLDYHEYDTFAANDICRADFGNWRNYVRGVAAELAAAGVAVPGGRMAIAGSVMQGTGLSSSASLEVAVAAILLHAAGLSWDPVRVALLAQRAECDFVGVHCGNLDQIASAAAQHGHALLIDCRDLALRHIPLHDDLAVMIVQSGVVRGLVAGEYNQRRMECAQAAGILGVPTLRYVDEARLEAGRGRMDELIFRRARHVIGDNRRTLDAAEALAADDLICMGALMRESHASQALDFGITVPRTDQLAAILNAAIGTEGGARQTGGGFGGAVIGLMRADSVKAVRAAVLQEYRTPTGQIPHISIEAPSGGLAVKAMA